jgi:hypothetical protein
MLEGDFADKCVKKDLFILKGDTRVSGIFKNLKFHSAICQGMCAYMKNHLNKSGFDLHICGGAMQFHFIKGFCRKYKGFLEKKPFSLQLLITCLNLFHFSSELPDFYSLIHRHPYRPYYSPYSHMAHGHIVIMWRYGHICHIVIRQPIWPLYYGCLRNKQ